MLKKIKEVNTFEDLENLGIGRVYCDISHRGGGIGFYSSDIASAFEVNEFGLPTWLRLILAPALLRLILAPALLRLILAPALLRLLLAPALLRLLLAPAWLRLLLACG